jgi:IS5 family transposase
MMMRQGTIADATLIAAPSSTKNKKGKCDPEKQQTKKANPVDYWMKVRIGIDKDSGVIHFVVIKATNVHDLTTASKLLHGEKEVVYGDAGYQGIARRAETTGHSATFQVAMRPGKCRALLDTPRRRAARSMGWQP